MGFKWERLWKWFPLQQTCLAAILPRALLSTQATKRLNDSSFARCRLTGQGQHWKAEGELVPTVRSLGFTEYELVTFTSLNWDLGSGGSRSLGLYCWPIFWCPNGLGYYGSIQMHLSTNKDKRHKMPLVFILLIFFIFCLTKFVMF